MTVQELIAALLALSAEQQAMRVVVSYACRTAHGDLKGLGEVERWDDENDGKPYFTLIV